MKKLLKIIKEIAIRVYVFAIFPLVCTIGFFGLLVLAEMLFQAME